MSAPRSVDDYRTLTGSEKAAILLLAVGEESATKIFAMMDDEEIKELSLVMAGLGAVSAQVIEQPAHWYGLDTLHVRRRHLDDLLLAACGAWGFPAPESHAKASVADWVKVGTKAAEVRSLAGVMRFTPQPALRLRSDGTLSLY